MVKSIKMVVTEAGMNQLRESHPDVFKSLMEVKSVLDSYDQSPKEGGIQGQLERLAYYQSTIHAIDLHRQLIRSTTSGFFFDKNAFYAKSTLGWVIRDLNRRSERIRGELSEVILDDQCLRMDQIVARQNHEIKKMLHEHKLERVLVFERDILDKHTNVDPQL